MPASSASVAVTKPVFPEGYEFHGYELRQLWRKAAVLGSLWASFEIVVGSFLHNLRVPFTGTILATIGLVILVAGARMWSDPRLLWRAALICALMKSISPTAVIFGPMVGIFMEGLLLFLAVRLLGATWLGYSIGGAMAVSWSLAQKIISLLLVYGTNVRALYVAAYAYAAQSLGIKRFGPYDLLLVLCAVQALAGITAAAVALRIGARASHDTPGVKPNLHEPHPQSFATGTTQRYSLALLFLTLSLLVFGIWVTNKLPIIWASLYAAGFLSLGMFLYPHSLRRMRKPRLWIELAIIMLLSGLVLGSVQRGHTMLGGLTIGGRMALRAALVIVGFAAISIELRNPKVLLILGTKRLANLTAALPTAFGFLPSFLSALSQCKQGWRRHPLHTLTDLIAIAGSLHASQAPRLRPVTVFITGEKGEGKTTFAATVVRDLQSHDYRVAGILAPGILTHGERSGFDIVDIAGGQRAPLARIDQTSENMFGRFAFQPEGLRIGQLALHRDRLARADIVVIDEVGRWELEDGGWAPQIDELMSLPGKPVIFVTRTQFADEVAIRWGRGDKFAIPVSSSTTGDVLVALGATGTQDFVEGEPEEQAT